MINQFLYQTTLNTKNSTDSEERRVLSIESQISELKEFSAKEKLEIVLSAPVPAYGQTSTPAM